MRPVTVNLCGYDKTEVAGGPIVWLMQIPSALRKRGIDVRVRLLTWDEPEDGVALQSLRNQGFEVSSCRFSDTSSNIRHFISDFENSPADVFVPNLVTPAYFAGKWIRATGTPTVGVLHSDDEFYRSIQSEFIHGRREFAVSVAVCVSQALLSQVSLEQPRHTIPVRIPYGVAVPHRIAQRTPGRLRIAFVGRLAEEQKQISELTRALCRVTREVDGVEATIYGDGPDRGKVEKILAAEGDTSRVRLAGAIPNEILQQRLVAECDTIVLLSDYEGLPISLLEGMACGLVPVCLNIRSGIPELISDGVSGLLIGDRQQGFTNAIRRLRDDGEAWSRMSKAARDRVQAEYSLDGSAERWCSLLQELRPAQSFDRITISLPRRLKLPPVNSGLKSQDRRLESPGFGARLDRFRNAFCRRLAAAMPSHLMGKSD